MSTSGTDAQSPYFAEFAPLSPRGFGTHEDATIRFSLDGHAVPVDVRMTIYQSEDPADQGTLANLVVSVPHPLRAAGGRSGGAYRSGAPEAAPLVLREVVLEVEAPADRRAKRAGLAREVQAGDPRFDDRVYVDTDASPAEVAKLLSDGGLRELVLRGLDMGMSAVRISTKQALVEVSSAREGVTADHVAEVAKLAADIGERLPVIRHVETRWGRELWPLSTAGVMLVASMGLHWMADRWYPTADSWLDHAPGLVMAFSTIGIAIPLSWLLARGRSAATLRFVFYAAAFSLVLPVFTYMAVWFGNGFFDRSPEIRSIVLLHEHGKTASDSPTYWLRVDSWRPREATIRIEVGEERYLRLTRPKPERLEIVRRAGALGADWLVEIRRR